MSHGAAGLLPLHSTRNHSLHYVCVYVQCLDQPSALLPHCKHPVAVGDLSGCNLGQHAAVTRIAHCQAGAAAAWLGAGRQLLKKLLALQQ